MRSDLMDYANKYQLTWIEDESNQSLVHDRNYLRHQVLPLLTQRWPQAKKQLVQSAEYAQSANNVLQQLSLQDLLTLDEARGALGKQY